MNSLNRWYALAAFVVVACAPSDPNGPARNGITSGRPGSDSTAPPPGDDSVSVLNPLDTLGLGGVTGGVYSQNDSGWVWIAGADVSLYKGDPANPQTWKLVRTTRTTPLDPAANSGFWFDSIPGGTYFLRADKTVDPHHAPGLSRTFTIYTGVMLGTGVFLPDVGARGVSYVRMWLRRWNSLYVCSPLWLRYSAGDAEGEPIADPALIWESRNPEVATIGDTLALEDHTKVRVIQGVSAGTATIVARLGTVADSMQVTVKACD